jgi:hypothetical protein
MRVTQTNTFADDSGNVIFVEYGVLEKDHVSTFVSPYNQKEQTFKSKLAVNVTLPKPSEEVFRAYQCMNLMRSGTLYKTEDGKWLYHANGTTCSIYLVNEDRSDYYVVFSGILSDRTKKSGRE